MAEKARFIRYDFRERSESEIFKRSGEFAGEMIKRRSVRNFSERPVNRGIIENILRAAGSAPSGANMQPWQFVAVGDPAIKQRIRAAAEREEEKFYSRTASGDWLAALSPLGTVPEKKFLEDAPWLISVFAEQYGLSSDGSRRRHYYVAKSVGIAVGFLLAAVHHSGLAALVYTPASMSFLNTILQRPENESPFAIIPVGYPAEDCLVPDIKRKIPREIIQFVE